MKNTLWASLRLQAVFISLKSTEEYVFFAGVLQLSFQLGGLKCVACSVIIYFFLYMFSLSIIHVLESQDINIHVLESQDINIHVLESQDINIHVLESQDINIHVLESQDINIHVLESQDINLIPSLNKEMNIINIHPYQLGLNLDEGNKFPPIKNPNHNTNFLAGSSSQCHWHCTSTYPPNSIRLTAICCMSSLLQLMLSYRRTHYMPTS